MSDLKTHLHRHGGLQRTALRMTFDGLTEREARLPRTPTGTNLLGLYKHAGVCQVIEWTQACFAHADATIEALPSTRPGTPVTPTSSASRSTAASACAPRVTTCLSGTNGAGQSTASG